jgi:hypothetical protein
MAVTWALMTQQVMCLANWPARFSGRTGAVAHRVGFGCRRRKAAGQSTKPFFFLSVEI